VKPRPPVPEGPFLIVGLARSGTAAALLLARRGESVIGVDAGSPAGIVQWRDAGVTLRDAGVELRAARVELHKAGVELQEAGVELNLHSDGLSALQRARTVIKSPGVPAQAPVIAAARAQGLPVLGELELAWRLLPNEIIAVTATNGKTTTVELIGHIHREAGLPVVVAGNVGVALSGLVGEVDPQATIVCEASSFQLEDTLAFAPEVALLLNFAPDHLDRHGTLADYLAAKLQIFARQDEHDLAVLPADLSESCAPLREQEIGGAARRVYFGGEREQRLANELRLPGAHNRQNAMAAAAVCLERGIDPAAVRAGLRSFAGVAHRLQEVACRDGVRWIDDSKATNVASTLVALRAFPGAGVHLILGGQGKGQDFSTLRDAVEGSCRAVYLIGEDAAQIARALVGSAVAVHDCGELERAVALAGETAADGEVVLLSPGCASFDQFSDFEARGRRFAELAAQFAAR
jgi:UDP-N-acetylmuramoylalanine--D-glutamate ligase